MVILAGLGNPDDEHKNSRHNLGFDVIIALAKKLDKDFATEASTYRANQFLKLIVGETETVLTLPLGYMNNSGDAIAQVMNFYGDNNSRDLWVVHDDTEVPFGEVRIKSAGTSGGHNGIKSIDEVIGAKYWRIRVGVGRPKHQGHDLANYVLAPFTAEEKKLIPAIIDRTVSYLLKSLDKGHMEATTFNAKEN